MKGKYRVVVSTKRLKYDFELHRNLTIIQGDSATGKTTMIDMIREFVNNPSGTPVELVCDKKCFVLEGALWKEQLSGIADSIVFIDEGNEFIKTTEFADEIQKTDNYFVIVTRESLPSLPYSVEEIYGIKTSGKYGTLKQSYHEFYRLYGANTYERNINPEMDIMSRAPAGTGKEPAYPIKEPASLSPWFRAVCSTDVMTATAAEIPHEVMVHITDRITHEVAGINRVLYDFTPKPTGTVEFE